jgi:hypothetical protein
VWPPRLNRKDILRLEEKIPKADAVADRTGRSYTRVEIARLEEQRVPWLRRRRQRG